LTYSTLDELGCIVNHIEAAVEQNVSWLKRLSRETKLSP
jgi:hypothetical protein